MDAWILWFLIGLGLIFSELFIPGVVLVFFGLSAWIVSGLSYFGLVVAPFAQVLIFGLGALVITAALRRVLKRVLLDTSNHAGSEYRELNAEFAGQSVEVLTVFESPGSLGKVEFNGTQWKACSEDELTPGDRAEIVSMNGLTLNIRRQWLLEI